MAYEKHEVEEVVAIIPQTQFTELRVTGVGTADGFEAVDIRQWYCTSKDPVKQPTKKGIRIDVELLPELIKAMMVTANDEVKAEIKEMGVI